MIIIKAILINNNIELIFPYNIHIINKVKKIPGRRWQPFPIKRWTVPYNQNSITALTDIGFDLQALEKLEQTIKETQEKEYEQMRIDLKDEFPFLYNYQIEAVAKGIINKKLYLADMMGLGKTIQSLSIMEHFMNKDIIQKIFVLCPSSIINQWKDESKRFKYVYKPITSKYKKQDRKQMYYHNSRIITTYDLVANDIQVLKKLDQNIKYGLILDEATRIKNPKTRRHKAIRQLKPEVAVYNSGTPFETKLTDVWNVASTLHPQWMTKKEYYGYCDYDMLSRYPKLLGYKNLDKFAKRFNEIGIKRTFKDVCSEAPIVTNYNHIIPQDAEQLRIEKIIKQKTGDDFISSATLLQMLSSHSLLLLSSSSPIVNELLKSSIKSASPKLKYLKDLLEEHDDKKIVIFSRFINMRTMLSSNLSKDYNVYNIINIKDFKEQMPHKSIIILGDSSIYGVDIPEASMLINFDILWNPAQMKQRNARIHRISSIHNIKIINLISEGIEQYMFDYNQRCEIDGIEATSINKLLKSFINFGKV